MSLYTVSGWEKNIDNIVVNTTSFSVYNTYGYETAARLTLAGIV